MTLKQVLGALLIFILCPSLGGLPLIAWIFRGAVGQRLSKLGTGNISVSAAFYHGGRLVGILAVLSEAFKGIAAVLLARYFFPNDATWELIALMAVVIGRYWFAHGAGTTNVVWGYVTYDWVGAGLIFLISGIGFTILRERRQGRLAVLVLVPLITALRHPHEGAQVGAAAVLSVLIAWIYQKIPDDLDLPANVAQGGSQSTFRFFRGDRAVLSLNQSLEVTKVGQKAATLAQLKQWGYPVPEGWVLPPGDDPAPLVAALQPTPKQPLVVRSSAIGEDSEAGSAAGLYDSILQVASQTALEQAIAQCQASYNAPAAAQYRQDLKLDETAMAVLVQQQVEGAFSGVAFSRDPIARQGDWVLIEALPGAATRVVSGQVTPEQYRVWVQDQDLALAGADAAAQQPGWLLPEAATLAMEGTGDVPPRLIQQVAYLVRQLEERYHGVPQDVEWTYDGQHLWILQARPITTLLPIWTRKIAAEVIPGFIHPLTWSINRPLTCGVWGDIFTVVLGPRAQHLDFTQTATLHHSAAYFNASLLGQIFRRMGLPPESLEFLTRGASFSKPPLTSTLKNVPGLWRLARQEWKLLTDFEQDEQQHFRPGLQQLAQSSASELDDAALLTRIHHILELLRRATYYSIMAPLSAALRQATLKVEDDQLDNGHTPEVASLRALQALAQDARSLIPDLIRTDLNTDLNTDAVFATLAESPDGQAIVQRLNQLVDRYGYLSEAATDIAVSTWREDPYPVREAFTQFLGQLQLPASEPGLTPPADQSWRVRQVQQRLTLKGRVTDVYSHFLAELRWSFIALEQRWLSSQLLAQPGDIFFLEFGEIQQLITHTSPSLAERLPGLVASRRSQLEHDRQLTPPTLVYGNDPPVWQPATMPTAEATGRQLRGIGASSGLVEGQVKILKTARAGLTIDRATILVVPYTDSGWAPLLSRAGGLIAEVGGRLSHGAIVAREYGIPAVMDVHNATQLLQDGQWVRLDGAQGIIELL